MIKEVISNTFNLIINKGEVIPPEQIANLMILIHNWLKLRTNLRENFLSFFIDICTYHTYN